jgi:predicted PurR-regulated permease PerM
MAGRFCIVHDAPFEAGINFQKLDIPRAMIKVILRMRFDSQRNGEIVWLAVVFLASLILISYLIFPLLEGIVLGIVFAYVGRPIMRLFGGRRRLGSLAGTLIIVIPLSLIFALGASEAVSQVIWLESHREMAVRAVSEFISTLPLSHFILTEMSGGLQNMLEIIAPLVASLPLVDLGRSLTLGTLNFLISLPVCYFLLLDGRRLEVAVMSLLPDKDADFRRRCLERIDAILSGIYLGSFYTAVAGGITSIAIFYIFGVPRPFAMACIVFLAGLVPFITWLVFIPTAIGRYFAFGPLDAVLFFLAGSILVHVAELVIRPYIVYAKSSLHPLLVLLSFLGGGLVAGVAGFFIAPAIMGVLMGIYETVKDERDRISNSDSDEQKSSDTQGHSRKAQEQKAQEIAMTDS